MQSCPSCQADNADDATVCAACHGEMRGDGDATESRAKLPPPKRRAPTDPSSEWGAPARAQAQIGADDHRGWSADEPKMRAVPPKTVAATPTTDAPVTAPQAARAATSTRSYDASHSDVQPLPALPDSGVIGSMGYSLDFIRARWQRRSAIKELNHAIAQDTAELDRVLGELGRAIREHRVDSKNLSIENTAIDDAESRRDELQRECAAIIARKNSENDNFADIENEWAAKVAALAQTLSDERAKLSASEAKRRSVHDKRRTLDRQRQNYLRNAQDRDDQAMKAADQTTRSELRRSSEDLRRQSSDLAPELKELDKELARLDRPISKATAEIEKYKAEHGAAKASLNDAREGHRQRLAEVDAELKHKTRDLNQSEAEIARRMVTLGTMANLNRVNNPVFTEMYARIDALRSTIGTRTADIDRLSAERNAFDKPTLIRGFVLLGTCVVLILIVIAVLLAIF